MSASRTPPGLGAAGRRFHKAVTGSFELEDHELAVLGECARTVDLLDALAADIRANGITSPDYGGRVSPCVVEARQQRLTLVKLLGALKLPADLADGDTPAAGYVRQDRRG